MRLVRFFLYFLMVAVFSAAFSESALAARKVAFIVGNSTYRNAPELRNPVNDAKATAEALEKMGFEIHLGLDLSKKEMDAELAGLSKSLKTADVSLFYYAGHGLQSNGVNYLLPVDAALRSGDSLDAESTSLNEVLRVMERYTKTNLVFLDACRDNPFSKQLKRSLASGNASNRSVGTGLAVIEVGKGTLITYSTQPGNVALDGTGFNSPFTTALVKWLKEPGLEIRQMLTRVRNDVLHATYGQQIPWDHSSLTGDFYFGDAKAQQQTAKKSGGMDLSSLNPQQLAALSKMLKGEVESVDGTYEARLDWARQGAGDSFPTTTYRITLKAKDGRLSILKQNNTSEIDKLRITAKYDKNGKILSGRVARKRKNHSFKLSGTLEKMTVSFVGGANRVTVSGLRKITN